MPDNPNYQLQSLGFKERGLTDLQEKLVPYRWAKSLIRSGSIICDKFVLKGRACDLGGRLLTSMTRSVSGWLDITRLVVLLVAYYFRAVG